MRDEFQDVAFIEEAPAQLRSCLEALGDVPILLLGSKRHMFADLFTAPEAPLSAWGTDLEFGPIPHGDYHENIEERFGPRRLTISREVAVRLQDDMQRVPEAINRLCAQLLELHEATAIDHAKVRAALAKLLENREGRYASYLSAFSAADENVLTEIARREIVAHPQSTSFLASVRLSNRTVALSVKGLWDGGVIEHVTDGYRVVDPLLAAYLVQRSLQPPPLPTVRIPNGDVVLAWSDTSRPASSRPATTSDRSRTAPRSTRWSR